MQIFGTSCHVDLLFETGSYIKYYVESVMFILTSIFKILLGGVQNQSAQNCVCVQIFVYLTACYQKDNLKL